MDPQLMSYVREQRSNGFSDDQIAAALKGQNYPESLIAATLAAASQPTVADAGLLRTYVQTYQQQGIPDEEIRGTLLQQGFSDSDITIALHQPVKKKHHAFLFVFPLLAAFILVGGYFFITSEMLTPEPTTPLPVVMQSVRLGEIIENLLPLANRNPTAALALCDSVVESDYQRCILTVSRESSDPSLCNDISEARLKDTCYLDFIYDGHYEFCLRLTLPSNIQYCNAVKPNIVLNPIAQ